MSGTFRFGIDRPRKLLKITFSGFFGVDDLAGYLDQKRAALAELGCRPNDHLTLCDFSACVPQSRAVLDLFGQSLSDPVYASRRLAVVVTSILGKMQAERIVERANTAYFNDVYHATAWLIADGQETGRTITTSTGWLPTHRESSPRAAAVQHG